MKRQRRADRLRQQHRGQRRRVPKPLKRKLHFPDGSIWTWQTRRDVIRIREPDGKTTHKVDLTEFSGWSWNELERAGWKGYGYEIKPGAMKEWIRFRFLKERDDPRPRPETPETPQRSIVDMLAEIVEPAT